MQVKPCNTCLIEFNEDEMVELPDVWICDGCYSWIDELLEDWEDDD